MSKAPSFKTVISTSEDHKLLSELTSEIHVITTGGKSPIGLWPAEADILYVKEGKRNGWDSIAELVEYTDNDHCFLSDDLPFVRFPAAVDRLKLYISELKQPPFPFKPFDQALMRNTSSGRWMPELYSHISRYFFGCGSPVAYVHLIGYSGNEELVNTNGTPASGYWRIESEKPTLIRC